MAIRYDNVSVTHTCNSGLTLENHKNHWFMQRLFDSKPVHISTKQPIVLSCNVIPPACIH